MKKSEMITHIAEEIKDMVNARAHSHENDDRYYQRRAAGLLDMLLGFGMLPPSVPTLTLNGVVFREKHEWEEEG